MREVVAVTPRGDALLCRVAEAGRDRRMGLRGARDLSVDAAFLFPNATSVHTLGMRFPLRVVRLDDAFTVVDVRKVRPGRFVPPMRRASHVLECHQDADVRVGDVLRIGATERQPAIARTSANNNIEATVMATTKIGTKRATQAGRATGSRRAESGSTSPRNSSSDRIDKASAADLEI
jgi:uncharacterized protein